MSCRLPCPSCPWRVDQHADAIPNFRLALAERLAATSRDGGFGPSYDAPQFACHQSTGREMIVCAGWLAIEGHAHPGARLNVALGHVDPAALTPGPNWPELHSSFAEVIAKLRADCET